MVNKTVLTNQINNLKRYYNLSNVECNQIKSVIFNSIYPGDAELKSIADFICEKYNVSINDLKARNNKRELSHPRIVFYITARLLTKKSTADIAKFVNKSHCNVIKYMKDYNDNYPIKKDVDEMIEIINNENEIV